MSSNEQRRTRVDAEIAAPLREASPGVDELHRARLVSAIDAALDREDSARDVRRRSGITEGPRRRWRLVAIAAVAAAVLIVVLRPHGRHAPATQQPAAVAGAQPAAPPSLLRPYAPAGHDATAAPATSLVALRGERARAMIGTRVRLTLVGAGRVSVLPAAREGDIDLALDGGRLLVEYDGHSGGTLRVRSPGATTTVIGTVFAVEAIGSGSRVSVTRGQVRTEDTAGHSAQVPAGTSWTSADGRSAPVPEELVTALAEHQAGWAEPLPVDADRPGDADHHERARRPAATTGPDLDALYARAEAAMRERSLGEARRTLEMIAARDPRGALGEAALLDLARLALADGDRAEARRVLARLPRALRDPALAETAAHLRCRAQPDGCDVPTDSPGR